MSADSEDELRAQRLRQRLWGATIVIALAVIFLPLLLDGSGSESQFRRVERLREEPPRVINVDGSRETVVVPIGNGVDDESWWQRTKKRFLEKPSQDSDRVGRDIDPVATEVEADEVLDVVSEPVNTEASSAIVDAAPNSDAPAEPAIEDADIRAWVVQAGGFGEEANANAVRDRLRRAGYPSFVTLNNDGTVYRVRVGPMINRDQAGTVQQSIMELLGREALVIPYP